MEDIAKTYKYSAPPQDIDVSIITDIDKVKDHIICKLINAEKNTGYA